jgi:hypothetical protein
MAHGEITARRIGRIQGSLDDAARLLDSYLRLESLEEHPDQRVLITLESAANHAGEAVDELALLLSLLNSKLPSTG